MKSALFVDFDNVFTQLRALQPAAAERFARQPVEWMRWLAERLEIPDGHADPAARRRVLVRRCYLNPNWYQQYRHAFLRAGFEIVDCPPVTSQGKTSTDIHMVLDIIELLQHETRYDEFIVLSADADFTPVLRKLRRYDRRTSVLAIGFPSAAYQASADLLIDERQFIEQALGLAAEGADHGEHTETAPTPGTPQAAVAHAAAPAEPAAPPPPPLAPAQLADIARRIEAAVAQSAHPVPAGPLALRLRQVHGPALDNWNGHGLFKPFFRSLGLDRLVWLSGSGGRIADPDRHASGLAAPAEAEAPAAEALAAPPGPHDAADTVADTADTVPAALADGPDAAAPADPAWAGHALLLPLAREISQLTGAPLLPPPVVRAVLDALCADLAQRPYEPTETARRVRSACLARTPAIDVSLRDVVFLLRGMQLNGHVFGRGLDDVATLAQRLTNQMLFLCQREQLPLPPDGLALLRQWMAADG
ncbi:NYN domain-containing protein [Pseudaquabacterium pictum]|uniref:NYN domain-containing protein n=1 Tax=Pseudaquabacterium pictum TaxID=2315236 RepID=A0A480AKE8_9BURK|nr:NYN domain-containing protein [Rubrivivax pictus]GCL61200.1 NYN domain-containing protein [Rubrivivax pictus]